MSKYRVFSGLYFPVFGPEKTPYLDTFHAVHYPSPYEREVRHYQKRNVDQFRQAIIEFPWENCFANINVNEQGELFSQAIQNIII